IKIEEQPESLLSFWRGQLRDFEKGLFYFRLLQFLKFFRRGGIAIFGRFFEPFVAFFLVLVHSITVEVAHRQIILGERLAVFRAFLLPFEFLFIVRGLLDILFLDLSRRERGSGCFGDSGWRARIILCGSAGWRDVARIITATADN